MFQMTVEDGEVVVEWEGRELNVWLYTKDEPMVRIRLSEHQVESIRRAINKVREEKWSNFQQNKQQDTRDSGS